MEQNSHFSLYYISSESQGIKISPKEKSTVCGGNYNLLIISSLFELIGTKNRKMWYM